MTKQQQILQDVLSVVLLFTLVGTSLEQSIQPILSAQTFSVVLVVLTGLSNLVYFADVIFFDKPPVIPPMPTTPAVAISEPTVVVPAA